MPGSNDEKLLYCSFCGKSQLEVIKLIAGPKVLICDECVESCVDIITEETGRVDVLRRLQESLRMLRLELSSDKRRFFFWGALTIMIVLQIAILYGIYTL